MNRFLLRAAGFGLAIGLTAASPTPALSEAQTQAVRDLVRQTLIDNPDILIEAMDALKEKHVAEQRAAQQAAILANASELIRADDPFLGAKMAKITGVEFFDYNCGYCRSSLPEIQAALKANPNARIIVKDLPVLGQESVAVSRLALASRAQGRYADYHIALMSAKGRLNEATALAIAKELKLDLKRLKKDATDKTVNETIARNQALAATLGIGGTPSFVIGETLFPGRIDAEALGQALTATKPAQNVK